MDADRPPARRALGSRRAHVVLAERREHTRPGQPDEDAAHAERQRRGGQDEVRESATARHGQPVESHGEGEHQDGTEPEARQAHAREARQADDAVEGTAAPHRGQDAERHGAADGAE